MLASYPPSYPNNPSSDPSHAAWATPLGLGWVAVRGGTTASELQIGVQGKKQRQRGEGSECHSK